MLAIVLSRKRSQSLSTLNLAMWIRDAAMFDKQLSLPVQIKIVPGPDGGTLVRGEGCRYGVGVWVPSERYTKTL